MENMTIKDIVEAAGGVLLCGDENKIIREFSIDSRQGGEDSIFVPIIGERVDSHRFIESALEMNGATFTSRHRPDGADRPWEKQEAMKPWIWVEDTIEAMQKVGTCYRNRLSLPVVAVTGSVGKTTTREMIAAALSAEKKVFQTMGNQNSQVGVPLTLSHMTGEDEMAVLEIGMSERGQIEKLTRMIRPDMAVVTVIGVSHIAQLKTQENICLEKMDIVKGLPKDGRLFLNGDDPFLASYRGKTEHETYFYGMSRDCDYRAEDIGIADGKTTFVFCAGEIRMPVVLGALGEHNVRNALAALAVAHQSGVSLERAATVLENFCGQRQKLVSCEECTVLDDAYNASPDSMKASIHVLSSMEGVTGRKIAALSDMLELGEGERQYHYEVGQYIGGSAIDEVVVFGELSEEILRGVADADKKGRIRLTKVGSRMEMKDYLLSSVRPEDVVLFKASNGMNLSEVVRAFTQRQ